MPLPKASQSPSDPATDTDTVTMTETSADIVVFTSPDGSKKLFQTPDGTLHTSQEEAEAYFADHQVDIIVGQFMAYVDEHAETLFVNKKGVTPGERALMAMKTRLQNNAKLVMSWYLQGA